MNLAVVHYHLNRGGVTQVIVNQLRALDTVAREGNRASHPKRVALLYGGRAQGFPENLRESLPSMNVSLHTVPGLDYDDSGPVEPETLSRAMEETLSDLGFGLDETVLHVHNHALGKNTGLPGAIVELARRGRRMVLEPHDFAEDLRPHLYRRLLERLPTRTGLSFTGELYPQASHLHYAFLNRGHEARAEDAGFERGRLHHLPNPVSPPAEHSSRASARRKLDALAGVSERSRFVVYPVRGIRRKNVGEMLLWAALGKGTSHYAMTLPPLNPREREAYTHWKTVAKELSLPCRFELGELPGWSFRESLDAADAVLTTSLAEGFGMVFLEAWLFSRPLIGRDLPEVTRDFVERGLRFDGLSDRFVVPSTWIDAEAFLEVFARAYERTLDAYGEPAPEGTALLDAVERATLHEDGIDFGLLPVELQERVLRRASGRLGDREELLQTNPKLTADLAGPNVIEANRENVLRHFGLDASGRRLLALYQRVLSSKVSTDLSPPARGETLLASFLAVERFRPLLVSP